MSDFLENYAFLREPFLPSEKKDEKKKLEKKRNEKEIKLKKKNKQTNKNKTKNKKTQPTDHALKVHPPCFFFVFVFVFFVAH